MRMLRLTTLAVLVMCGVIMNGCDTIPGFNCSTATDIGGDGEATSLFFSLGGEHAFSYVPQQSGIFTVMADPAGSNSIEWKLGVYGDCSGAGFGTKLAETQGTGALMAQFSGTAGDQVYFSVKAISVSAATTYNLKVMYDGVATPTPTPTTPPTATPTAVPTPVVVSDTYDLHAGWNAWSPTMNFGAAYTASDLDADFATQGLNLLSVGILVDGDWIMYRSGLPFNNFHIFAGVGYFLELENAGTVTLSGVEITGATRMYLFEGWNLVGLPSYAGGMTADGMMGAMNTAYSDTMTDMMADWDGRKWKVQLLGGPNDFPMYHGVAYFIHATDQFNMDF